MTQNSLSFPSADAVLLGIDIGGTKILGGIVSQKGEILFQHRLPTRRSELAQDIVRMADVLTAEVSRTALESIGIGVGMTGFIDRKTGTLIKSINLGIGEIPIGDLLHRATGLPVFVDNDVHAATLGEIYFGVGRLYPDFLLYNAGTGLATGIVFDGKLHRGASNAAGENGHMSAHQSDDAICSCGMSGCIEHLLLQTRRGVDTVPAYLPRIEKPAKKEYSYLALNLVQLANFMNPSAIILAGGMFTGNPEGTEWVRRAVVAHALPIVADGLKVIELSRTAPFTGLVGAAALAMETLPSTPISRLQP
jgi:glucokinase